MWFQETSVNKLITYIYIYGFMLREKGFSLPITAQNVLYVRPDCLHCPKPKSLNFNYGCRKSDLLLHHFPQRLLMLRILEIHYSWVYFIVSKSKKFVMWKHKLTAFIKFVTMIYYNLLILSYYYLFNSLIFVFLSGSKTFLCWIGRKVYFKTIGWGSYNILYSHLGLF